MQLNNTNGTVIKITNYFINKNRIKYNVLEFGSGNILESKAHDFTSIQLIDFLNKETNFESLCLEKLKEEKETTYTLSNDVLNWTIQQGASGLSTLRVYLPAVLLSEELNTGSNLDLLIESMKVYNNQLQRLENGNMQYLTYIDALAKTLLESYANKGVVIQEK